MTHARFRTAAGVLLSVEAALALAGTAGLDVGSAPPAHADGPYRQTRVCVRDGVPPRTVTQGVSWAQQQLRYPELWPLATGAGVTVAVIDSGVTPSVAFGHRLIGGGDLIVPAENGLVDCDGHGTLVAGIVAGASDSATGFAGVAPGATILSIRQASSAYAPAAGGTQGAGTPDSLADAVLLAVATGAGIINISEADCGPASAVRHARLDAAVRTAPEHDALIVVAAGNLGSGGACQTQNTPGQQPVTGATPADIPGVIAVGATDQHGAAAAFSLAGPWVSLAAPGVGLVSVDPFPGRAGQVDSLFTGQGMSPVDGTSFASPYVAGVAALIRERYPRLSAAQVRTRLLVTATGGHGPGGRNDATGYGVVDPRAALTAVLPQEGAAGIAVVGTAAAAEGPRPTDGPSTTTPSTGDGGSGQGRVAALPPLPPAPAPDPVRGPALAVAGGFAFMTLVGAFTAAVRRRQ